MFTVTLFHSLACTGAVTLGLQTASQNFPVLSFISGVLQQTLHWRVPKNNAYYLGHVKPLCDLRC